jgi:hypothetical protein
MVQKKKVQAGNFGDIISSMSTYMRESGTKLKGRGAFGKLAGEIYRDVKEKPNWKESLDIKKYFPKIDNKKLEDLELYIKNNAFDSIPWYNSDRDFKQLIEENRYWDISCVLRIKDSLKGYRDFRTHDNYYRTMWTVLKGDYKADRMHSSEVNFSFDEIQSVNGNTIVVYEVENWDFSGYESTMAEVGELSRKTKEEKEKEKDKKKTPPEEPRPLDVDFELKKEELKLRSEEREKAFKLEREMLFEEFKAGLWSKEEYKQLQEELRKRYQL